MMSYNPLDDYGVIKINVRCSANNYIRRAFIYKAIKLTVYHGFECIARSESVSEWKNDKIELQFHINGPWPIFVYLVVGHVLSKKLIFNIPMNVLRNGEPHFYKNNDYGLDIEATCGLFRKSTLVPSLLRPYYEWRPSENIVLYNDASGTPSAWCDISWAVDNAQTFIYIAGWSLDVSQRLCRDSYGDHPPLGVQLLSKAKHGVQVLILLWDEPGSIVNTHDEEVYKYFNHKRGVRVLMAKRSTKLAKIPSKYFSHHQKIIAMDLLIPDTSPSVKKTQLKTTSVAFLGGLDITTGRYDTPAHTLWSENHTTFAGDFRQTCIPNTSVFEGAPRIPWHDVHCQITGEAAEDAIHTFRNRWMNEMKRQPRMTDDDGLSTRDIMGEMLLLSRYPRGSLFNIEKIDSKNTWNVHIVRSIDSSSLSFSDSNHPHETIMKTAFGHIVDNSIHQAMVDAIRLAERFIYIEQQYFISSSQAWDPPSKTCTNIIALEISSAICRAINNNKPFHVYIIVPMHPEGDPNSFVVSGILYYQAQTVSVIVREVNKYLKDKERQGSIADYLSIMTLASQEPQTQKSYEFPATPGTREELISKSRRFMIYVHSKLLIVDDKFIILGSANINQRSLSGSRDTEIAMYAYQTKEGGSHLENRGEIYKFRRRLWDEHFSKMEVRSIFRNPERGQCIRAVYEIAQNNLVLFASTFTNPLKGHAMIYPYTFAETRVEAHRLMPYIPDCFSRVSFLGKPPRNRFTKRLLS